MSQNTVIRVGDRVRFLFGTEMATGTVKEDRGPIGIKGRRLYTVAFSLGPEFSANIELPAEEMEVVSDSDSRG